MQGIAHSFGIVRAALTPEAPLLHHCGNLYEWTQHGLALKHQLKHQVLTEPRFIFQKSCAFIKILAKAFHRCAILM